MKDRKGMTEEDALACLQRNGVRITEKTTERNGIKVVYSRLIRPGIPAGLKVLSAIDCLVKYFPKRKYHYQSA